MDDTQPALATYRLQFNEQFRFEDANKLVPYLSRLGITHVYSSPILRARSGSTHGYDVVDPRTIHPGLGDENDFRALVTSLHSYGLGLILDIVPNHMAASSTENPYWHDVLMYGRAAPYANWFDIDWRMPSRGLWGRVLVPVLGESLSRVLESDQLGIVWQEGRFRVQYFDHVFPLDPASVPTVLQFGWEELRECLGETHPSLGELRSTLDRLDSLPSRYKRMRNDEPLPIKDIELWQAQIAQSIASSPQIQSWAENCAARFSQGEAGRQRFRKLLDQQNYRLVFWRRAARAINYRRFFDINDLVSIRQEDPQVFEQTHETLIRWIREGLVDGLRVDHLDGLRDPRGYLKRLRESITLDHAPRQTRLIYVEKILACDEQLRKCWPVDGTTGYGFMNRVESVLISEQGFAEIVSNYRRLLRRPVGFDSFAQSGKRRVLCNELSALVGRLADLLLRLAQEAPDLHVRLTKQQLAEAIVEVAVALPVYRTYIDERGELDSSDARFLKIAFDNATKTLKALPEPLEFLKEVLLLDRKDELPEDIVRQRIQFIQRFQQLTGPAAAKGIEDTALYAFAPLASRNEVGGEPDHPLTNSIEEFHQWNATIAESFPLAMLSATTHDTKRTADVRARLDVLSEVPQVWRRFVNRWQRMNRVHRKRTRGKWAPDGATEYLFYQSLVGIWPAPDPSTDELQLPSDEIRVDLHQRLDQYMEKASREAKTHTNWVNPNQDFEAALKSFIHGCFFGSPETPTTFLDEVHTFVAQIARYGFWNSLSRTAIQFTSPGTPDVYQGDEVWNFALVDPDNRRPVDYDQRQRLLDEIIVAQEQSGSTSGLLRSLVEHPEDGRLKLYLIHHLLRARREYPELFASGSYEPLEMTGPHANHLIGFVRRIQGQCAVTVVPRLTSSLVDHVSKPPLGAEVWDGEDAIQLPELQPEATWRSLLTGDCLPTQCSSRSGPGGSGRPSATAQISELFSQLPVAVIAARNL